MTSRAFGNHAAAAEHARLMAAYVALAELPPEGRRRQPIRVGDLVRCRPDHGRAFDGKVVAILARVEEPDAPYRVDVVGAPKGRPLILRTLWPRCVFPKPSKKETP